MFFIQNYSGFQICHLFSSMTEFIVIVKIVIQGSIHTFFAAYGYKKPKIDLHS